MDPTADPPSMDLLTTGASARQRVWLASQASMASTEVPKILMPHLAARGWRRWMPLVNPSTTTGSDAVDQLAVDTSDL